MTNPSTIKTIAATSAVFLSVALIYNSRNIIAHVFSSPDNTLPNLHNRPVHKDDIEGRIQQAAYEYDMGNIDQAKQLYGQLIIDHPQQVPTLTQFGNTLCSKKMYDHAIACLQVIIDTHPSYPSSYVCLGIALNAQQKPEQAIPYFERALTQHNNYPDAYVHMGKSYLELDRGEEAITAAQKAINLDPRNPLLLVNLGDTYNKLGFPHKARDYYTRSQQLDKKNIGAEYGLGYADLMEGNLETAIDHFNATIEVNPNHYDAHLGLAFSYWALDDLPKAFKEYEWRFEKDNKSPHLLPKPMWDGSDLKGKSILLYAEQGMGDTIQFLRFAKLLKERGARVVCGVQEPLTQLLSLCPYIDEIRMEYTFDGVDYQAPLMSLGHIMKLTKDTIPTPIPYIAVDETLSREWKQKLSTDKNLKVGICWHVDPIHEKIKSPLGKRSISLKNLAPLAQVKNVSFYSLQKINGELELVDKPANFKINTFENFDADHGRFMDTAALINNLDLIITVDTVIAHLAGALGKRVWMFLPYTPDGRWSLKRSTTPWYPTVTIFRQTKPFEWTDPITQVKNKLAALAHTTAQA